MKKIRLLLLFPVLLAAVALLIGCIDRDGNYEKVDIWMEGIDLHGTLFYTRTKDNARHEIAKLELGEGRLFVYPAPAGSSVVTGYREGEFLVNGIIFSPSGGVESDVVGFTKADNRTVVQRIETEYFVTVLPMLSNDGVSVAFHGRKEPGDELTVGIYDMENGQSRTIPCPEKKCSNARWSGDDEKIFFIADGRSAYYLDISTGRETNFFSLGEGGAKIGDILSYNQEVAIISILNGRLRDGGSLIKVNVESGGATTIYESGNCSIPGINRTGMQDVVLYTKSCFRPPSQGVYLYNMKTGEEVRVSDPGWMAHDGGWVDK